MVHFWFHDLAPIDRVGPFWGDERLDGGTHRAAIASDHAGCILEAQSIKCLHYLVLAFCSHGVLRVLVWVLLSLTGGCAACYCASLYL
jgi:hypothetical protein